MTDLPANATPNSGWQSDIIVDLTSSGTTLKDNRLREIEGGTVLDSAACLIGHGPSLRALFQEGEAGPLALLLRDWQSDLVL